MNPSFLSVATQGKNALWRYVTGLGVSLLLGWVGYQWVGVPIAQGITDLSAAWENHLSAPPPLVAGLATLTPYLTVHLAYVFLGAGLWVTVPLLHQRPSQTLISPTATLRPHRFALGFGIWWVLICCQMGWEYWSHPSGWQWNFQPLNWGLFLPLALLLTPIQASTEELLFRGYLLPAAGRIVSSPGLLILLSGFIFAIAHGQNPELDRGALWMVLTYGWMGCFLTAITLWDRRLELALGIHSANNLFVVLVVNTEDSVLPTPALWIQQHPTDPRWSLLAMVGMTIVFWGLVNAVQSRSRK